MDKKLKIFIIVFGILIIGAVVFLIINSRSSDVDPFTAEYREDTYVDDFVFMNANLFKANDDNYVFTVVVLNNSDKDYDIGSIEVNFYNTKDKKIGSMLYVMEEDMFYHGSTIQIALSKNINLRSANGIKYKINYK